MAFGPTSPQDLARVISDQKQTPGDVKVSGNAKVHIGDSYTFNRDLLEAGTAKERNDAVLNILHFDGEDAKRNQLTLSGPVEQSLKWIKETSFMDWLRAPTPMPFWIQGKPASGKSTLMKHLSESKFTRDTINESSDDGAWTIVYFFFDYRAGTTTANNTLGMLKYFMKQLGDKLSSIKDVFNVLKSNDEEKYLDVLVDTITKSNIRVCAFVDGLDEFEGDLWDLCLLLERLRTRTGMRMCLASRPEPAFEASYGKTGCPTITMQDHNAATIRTWLEYKVERFKADHILAHELFTPDLLEEIVTRAQGVILWARLVMDEMIKSCHGNAIDTQAGLMDILASLPPDLEPLYERILNKTNARYRSEIAWLLSLIDDVGGAYDRDRRSPLLLCQALNYLQVAYLGEQKLLPSNLADAVYETRIKVLLGNLVDVEIDPDPQRQKLQYPQIRLIHKSLSTYLERSRWIPRNVPESAKPLCMKPVWKRVTIDMMERLSPNQPLDCVKLSTYSRDVRIFAYNDLKKMCINQKKHPAFVSAQYRPWSVMIIYLVSQFFSLGHGKVLGMVRKARIENVNRNGKLHLVLDLNHGHTDRLLKALNSEEKRSVVQDLYDLALIASSKSISSQKLQSLLPAFVEHGYYIEPRHICMAPALLRHRLEAKVFIEAAKKTPEHRALHIHDRDCPDREKHADFGKHWLTLNTVDNVMFLDLIAALNVDLDEPFKSEGGFYHGLLNLASPTDKTLTDKALERFMAAAFQGRPPEPHLLQHARMLRSKVKWAPLETHGLPVRNGTQYLNMTTEVYVKFLDWAIIGLRYHAKFGNWQNIWCRSVLVGVSKVLTLGPFWMMERELGPDIETIPAVEKPEKTKKRLRLTLRVRKQSKAKIG